MNKTWVFLTINTIFWFVFESNVAFSTTAIPVPPLYGSDSGGGRVACLKSDGGIDDLVAAKVDISKGITWGGEGQAIGKSAQSDTDGAANSKAIVATLGRTSLYAALLCDRYEIDSSGHSPCLKGTTCYKGWFLPARYQLECLYQHKDKIGGFAEDFYWSSSEFAGYPQYTAWDKFFGAGEGPIDREEERFRVRCVRYFTP